MMDICDYEKCTGCMACYNACSKGAITINQDTEGFLRPVIDRTKCIDCKLCSRVCPVNQNAEMRKPEQIYCGWSRNNKVRLSSSSGGAFFELAIKIIEDGGCVFGCKLNESLMTEHSIAETKSDLEALKGSKYSQSIIGDTYKRVKEQLLNNRTVLFCGTSCQVAGLLKYLRKPFANLITVDFICHGVPSPKLFEDYKNYIKQTEGFSSIDSIQFRRKQKSWVQYNMEVIGKDNQNHPVLYIGHYLDDPWIRGFLSDNFLRPSCYTCQFSNIKRVSDFTLADWWSYNNPSNGDYSYLKLGVSSITCNTEKAIGFFENVKDKFYLEKRKESDYIGSNPSLSHSWSAPATRKEFWKDYEELGFEFLIDKYMYHKRFTLSQHISTTDLSTYKRRLFYLITSKTERILRRLGLSKLIIKY